MTTVAASVSERDFTTRFLTLASLNEPVLAANYQKPLKDVTALGAALPALKYRYNPNRAKRVHTSDSENQNDIKLTLKSIRNPKFVIINNFNKNDTILQIKESILKEGKVEKIEQLKFLLKGKVLHDNLLLLELGTEEATINVMVSAPKPQTNSSSVPITQSTPVPDEEPVQESIADLENISLPWNEIEILLQGKLKNAEEVNFAVERLKKGWNLAK